MSDLSKRVEALAKQWDRLSHNKAIAISAQIAHGEDARALRSLLAESLEEGKPVRAWHELTDAERKEWNDGVMDPEAGRHTFQSFDHAYRLIVGREMPRTQQGDAALRGTGEGKP